MYLHCWGEGPRVVLVHGSILGGRHAWVDQRPLTRRWTLVAPDLPGHGDAPEGPNDFEESAELVACELLGEPVHLVTRAPGDARLPLQQLAAAPFRSLVLTGGHSPAFEAIADAIAAAVAAERDIVPGAGHLCPIPAPASTTDSSTSSCPPADNGRRAFWMQTAASRPRITVVAVGEMLASWLASRCWRCVGFRTCICQDHQSWSWLWNCLELAGMRNVGVVNVGDRMRFQVTRT